MGLRHSKFNSLLLLAYWDSVDVQPPALRTHKQNNNVIARSRARVSHIINANAFVAVAGNDEFMRSSDVVLVAVSKQSANHITRYLKVSHPVNNKTLFVLLGAARRWSGGISYRVRPYPGI